MFSFRDVSLFSVHFTQLEGGQVYAFNPQYLELLGCPKHHKKFSDRLDCILEVDGIERAQTSARDYAYLECLNPTERHRHAKHSPTSIYRTDLELSTRGINGNLLVGLYAAICHSCGKYRDYCWRNYMNHYLCPCCRKAGKNKPPFPFGKGSIRCCSVAGCGDKKIPFQDKEGEAVLCKALRIYERHRER